MAQNPIQEKEKGIPRIMMKRNPMVAIVQQETSIIIVDFLMCLTILIAILQFYERVWEELMICTSEIKQIQKEEGQLFFFFKYSTFNVGFKLMTWRLGFGCSTDWPGHQPGAPKGGQTIINKFKKILKTIQY